MMINGKVLRVDKNGVECLEKKQTSTEKMRADRGLVAARTLHLERWDSNSALYPTRPSPSAQPSRHSRQLPALACYPSVCCFPTFSIVYHH